MAAEMEPTEATRGRAAGPVTQILVRAREGDETAREELYAAVYGELRRIAGAQVGRQGARAPVQPTSLVHEAFLRLAGASEVRYEDRLHFFRTAARAMRSVVVDLARARAAAKRGGDRVRITFEEWGHGATDSVLEVLAVHEALKRLESLDPDAASVVELRFFAGLTPAETAAALDLNERTVFRIWNRARAWLHREIST